MSTIGTRRTGTGSPDDPWMLHTPPGTAEYRDPLLEHLGLAELEHGAYSNRMRAQ